MRRMFLLVLIFAAIRAFGEKDRQHQHHARFPVKHVIFIVKENRTFDKFIETNWDLPSLTDRDADAVDMTQDFDFDQRPRHPPRLEQRSECTQF
jgi:hypothetical protein